MTSVLDSIFVGLFTVIFAICAAGFLWYYEHVDLETKAFIRLQFDKLLVSALLMFAFFLLTHNLKYYLGQDSVINQTWGVVTFFLGMLSGLITGSSGNHRATDKQTLDSKGKPNATIEVTGPDTTPDVIADSVPASRPAGS